MSKYAANTEVSTERSRAEIERILTRYKATGFLYGWDQDKAVIGFRIENRTIRITLPLPDRNSRAITHTPARRTLRSPKEQQAAFEQATKQRWRALALIIKAKLEAVESGISTIEKEFMANIVMPNGLTIGEWAKPQLEEMYQHGQMPPMLPSGN